MSDPLPQAIRPNSTIAALGPVPNPTFPSDIANKQYVDAHVGPTPNPDTPYRLAGGREINLVAGPPNKMFYPAHIGFLPGNHPWRPNPIGRFPCIPLGYTFRADILRGGCATTGTPTSGAVITMLWEKWTISTNTGVSIGSVSLDAGVANDYRYETNLENNTLTGDDTTLAVRIQASSALQNYMLWFECFGHLSPLPTPVPDAGKKTSLTRTSIRTALSRVLRPVMPARLD